jgi:hypothetical protein
VNRYTALSVLVARRAVQERIYRDESALIEFHDKRSAEHTERALFAALVLDQLEAEIAALSPTTHLATARYAAPAASSVSTTGAAAGGSSSGGR